MNKTIKALIIALSVMAAFALGYFSGVAIELFSPENVKARKVERIFELGGIHVLNDSEFTAEYSTPVHQTDVICNLDIIALTPTNAKLMRQEVEQNAAWAYSHDIPATLGRKLDTFYIYEWSDTLSGYYRTARFDKDPGNFALMIFDTTDSILYSGSFYD